MEPRCSFHGGQERKGERRGWRYYIPFKVMPLMTWLPSTRFHNYPGSQENRTAFPQSLHICLDFIHHSSLSVTSCELETPGWPSQLLQGPGRSNYLSLPRAFCLSWSWFTSAICKLISNTSHKWVMPGSPFERKSATFTILPAIGVIVVTSRNLHISSHQCTAVWWTQMRILSPLGYYYRQPMPGVCTFKTRCLLRSPLPLIVMQIAWIKASRKCLRGAWESILNK